MRCATRLAPPCCVPIPTPTHSHPTHPTISPPRSPTKPPSHLDSPDSCDGRRYAPQGQKARSGASVYGCEAHTGALVGIELESRISCNQAGSDPSQAESDQKPMVNRFPVAHSPYTAPSLIQRVPRAAPGRRGGWYTSPIGSRALQRPGCAACVEPHERQMDWCAAARTA